MQTAGSLQITVATGFVLVVLAVCASRPATVETPTRSLDELYEVADRVNAIAEPYRLGTGDAIGAQTYGIYVRGLEMNAPPGKTPVANSLTSGWMKR